MATQAIPQELDGAELARAVAGIPLAEIDVARPSLFQSDKVGTFFERLRRNALDSFANVSSRRRWAALWAASEIP